MRLLLRVAYDGTSYSGWQRQDNAVTIEGELNSAISELTGEQVEVIGASRTDAGVHSLGNICVFDTETKIPAEKFCYAINNLLPADIRVIESREVDGNFHPRHCDSVKTYEYRIWNDIFPNPVLERYSFFTYRRLNLERMREAAAKLVGEHDFGAFCSSGSQAETTVRTIHSLDIFDDYLEDYAVKGHDTADYDTADHNNGGNDIYQFGRIIRIRVSGSGFLYNMVRIIAGTLLDIGMGNMQVNDIDKCLKDCRRENAGNTAPAAGLTMIGIKCEQI